MAYQEVIDHPLDAHEAEESPEVLAGYVAIKVLKYYGIQGEELGELEHETENPEDHPEGESPTERSSGRVTSWVETPDARFGHALTVSRMKHDGRMALEGRYFVIDRKEHSLVEGEERAIVLPSNTPEHPISAHDYAEVLERVFTTDQLIHLRNMFAKLIDPDISSAPLEETVDKDVFVTLLGENIDAVNQLTSRTAGESEEKTGENIFLDTDFIAAIKKRFNPSEEDPAIALRGEIDGQPHAVVTEYDIDGVPEQVSILRKGDEGWEGDFFDHTDLSDEQYPAYSWNKDAIMKLIRTGEVFSYHTAARYVEEALQNE